MAQFVVRNLEDDVKARLKRRAAHHGRMFFKKFLISLRHSGADLFRIFWSGSRDEVQLARTKRTQFDRC